MVNTRLNFNQLKMKKARILVLSDLYWAHNLKYLSDEEVRQFTAEQLSEPDFQTLKKYLSIIFYEEVDLVVLAGDITGDGSCGHGYQNVVTLLLMILEAHEKPTVLISGNHDLEMNYTPLLDYMKDFDYCQEISNQSYEINGVRLFGLSYENSNKKKILKKILKEQANEQFDLVVAHTELKRRTWLFDFNTKAIVTGHFDKKMSLIQDKLFVSLDNNFFADFTYCVFTIEEEEVSADYVFLTDGQVARVTEHLSELRKNQWAKSYLLNQHPIAIETSAMQLSAQDLLPLTDFRGIHFKLGVEKLHAYKQAGKKLSEREIRSLTQLTVHQDFKFSKTIMKDYLG